MSWLEEVAAQAGVAGDAAGRMLRRRGIAADRPLRPARTLTVRRIAFSGEKRGRVTGPFAFDWSPLAPGVWALASHENLVGKSTVLEVLLWALRGQPKGLQPEIRRWLDRVSVEFLIDAERYVVDFAVLQGRPEGTLVRVRPSEASDVLERFASDPAFEAAMSHFMMDALDLDPVPAHHAPASTGTQSGQTVYHDWLALSGVLYFGGDHKLLLGDQKWGGLPARLLQMFVGLPWARTVMQASAAVKEVDQEAAAAAHAAASTARQAAEARQRLEAAQAEARARLGASYAEASTAERLAELAIEVARLGAMATELGGRLAEAEANAAALRRVRDEDERAARGLREDFVATEFFNGLQPTCCPRCDATVSAARRQREATDLSCSVCATPIAPDRVERASDALADADARFEASAAAAARAEAELAPLRAVYAQARGDLDRTSNELRAAAGSGAFHERRAAELELARVEGALRERGDALSTAEGPTDAPLVRAALSRARAAYDAARGDLLEALSAEILRLGAAFGIVALEAVQVDAGARMQLQKGGETMWFSTVTAGERLRLRIATAVALLRVGRERGMGRHPGLLIVDSPGAEETNETNLDALLHELRRVADETPGLQIFVASANAPAVMAVLDADHCRIAAPGTHLW